MERLVSFVDLAPTLLSLVETQAPDYMQGNAFLGKYQKEEPENIYMFRDRMDGRYDMSRSIVDHTYRYTLNFNSNRIYMQHLNYLWRAPSMQSWEDAYKAGDCNEVQARWFESKPVEELYDTEKDPWEVNNLASDPAYADRLVAMRRTMMEMGSSMKDAGYIPEAERIIRTGDMAAYDYMRTDKVPYQEIQEAAFLASRADPGNMAKLVDLLGHDDSAVRYWAAQGLLMLGETSESHLDKILECAFDPSWNVSVVGAEMLYLLGHQDEAVKAYHRVLGCDQAMARLHALNSIESIGGSADQFLVPCLEVLGNYEKLENQYDVRVISWLFEKWEVDPKEHGIKFSS